MRKRPPPDELGAWKYAYPLGHFAYEGDWDNYWKTHKKMRSEQWSLAKRIAFRIGAVVSWLRGDRWKP